MLSKLILLCLGYASNNKIMRIVDEIPHERFKIQIFSYNSKYTLKIELDQFEQSFKIGELDVMGTDDIKSMVTTEFLNKCLKR
jgi:hypothetical protein